MDFPSTIDLHPIGVIRSPYQEPSRTPIQPVAARNTAGTVEVFPEFAEGLRDLEGFSHVMLLYYFHRSRKCSLLVTPYLDDEARGVFATRAPSRPNAIGVSIVRLVSVEGNTLAVKDLDVLDGTPLLDIKPHVEGFHVHGKQRLGWLGPRMAAARGKKGDERFSGK
ncbi:MAG: tRNA (N6-threonylcarbamoyladenosine(37)-N6)-methyltransferase TrmO [Thermodesulfobacteriota bacterium]